MADDIKEAREIFGRAETAESHNRKTYKEDTVFARGGDQWPDKIRTMREKENRPVLTINKLPAFIRQVVNDARQNKPSIKVHPVDSGADPETADVINGIIRNIENNSNADTAYDTATECAVSGGFGYWRIVDDYSYEDSFEKDLFIRRIANPLTVYGDPNSTSADSEAWDDAFVTDTLSKEQFKAKYKGAKKADFSSAEWGKVGDSWHRDETVTIAEWWKRREHEQKVLQLSNDMIVTEDDLKRNPDLQSLLASGQATVVRERMAKCHKVTQHIMSGAEILETTPWMGKYIPIIPVYGDEFDIEGKRYWRSLIHSAIDAQRMVNYWRSTSVELLALAPKVPFIGPEGAFTDPNWQTANTQNHPYLEYDVKAVAAAGGIPPQRQPLDTGAAAGALMEAQSATDDMKSIMGLFDASLGAKSNETSGVAINARKREGDVSTFHFIDNMARGIRHTGRILIDLIPHYYSTARVVRIIGEDGTQSAKQINQPYPVVDEKTGEPQQQPQVGPDGQPMQDEQGNPIMEAVLAMHDLRAGKYDLTVSTGPSFTTRREEAAMQMTELVRAFPESAPIIMPKLAKNLDWPGADEIAEEFEKLTQNQVPPEIQKTLDDGKAELERLTQENQQLKMDQSAEMAKIDMQRNADTAEMKFKEDSKMAEMAMEERIQMAEMAMKERIAEKQAVLDAKVANYKAELTAKASVAAAAMKPQPQGNSNGKSG